MYPTIERGNSYQESLRILRQEIIFNTLPTLVAEQEKEWQSEQLDPTSLATRKALFDYYKQNKMFKRAYQEAMRFHYLPRREEELQEFRSRFAGRIFHDLAQISTSAKLSNSRILLSPERTLKFYGDLYSGARRTRHSFGFDSLVGISVPDGLIVEKENDKVQIVAVCEYTLHGDEQSLRRKHDRFGREKKDFPGLFAEDAHLLFVVPRKTKLRHQGILGSSQFQELPFTHSQFRDFLNSFYQFYRPDEDSATLLEIRERAQEQYGRVQERYQDDNLLTPEDTEYLVKCWR